MFRRVCKFSVCGCQILNQVFFTFHLSPFKVKVYSNRCKLPATLLPHPGQKQLLRMKFLILLPTQPSEEQAQSLQSCSSVWYPLLNSIPNLTVWSHRKTNLPLRHRWVIVPRNRYIIKEDSRKVTMVNTNEFFKLLLSNENHASFDHYLPGSGLFNDILQVYPCCCKRQDSFL